MLIRTQVLLPQNTLTYLRFLATEQQTSVSELVRKALQKEFSLNSDTLEGTKSLLHLAKKAYTKPLPKHFSSQNVDDLYTED